MQVRWKQFAIDFDDFPMPLKAHSLPTTYLLPRAYHTYSLLIEDDESLMTTYPCRSQAHSDFDEVLADPQMYNELQARK